MSTALNGSKFSPSLLVVSLVLLLLAACGNPEVEQLTDNQVPPSNGQLRPLLGEGVDTSGLREEDVLDENGILVGRNWYDEEDSLNFREVYRYDSRGNRVENRFLDAEDNLLWTFEYFYNEDNQRIEERLYDNQGEIVSIFLHDEESPEGFAPSSTGQSLYGDVPQDTLGEYGQDSTTVDSGTASQDGASAPEGSGTLGGTLIQTSSGRPLGSTPNIPGK